MNKQNLKKTASKGLAKALVIVGGAVMTDMSFSAVQYSFTETGCPSFRHATIGNLIATFANVTEPLYDTKNMSDSFNENYKKIAKDTAEKTIDCYYFLPSNYLVKYSKDFNTYFAKIPTAEIKP